MQGVCGEVFPIKRVVQYRHLRSNINNKCHHYVSQLQTACFERLRCTGYRVHREYKRCRFIWLLYLNDGTPLSGRSATLHSDSFLSTVGKFSFWQDISRCLSRVNCNHTALVPECWWLCVYSCSALPQRNKTSTGQLEPWATQIWHCLWPVSLII